MSQRFEGMDATSTVGGVRASAVHYNTLDEIKQLVDAVAALARGS